MSIKSALVNRLVDKKKYATAFSDVVAIVQSWDAGQKKYFVDALVNNTGDAGEMIGQELRQKIITEAEAEADAILANQSMTVQELLAILG